MQDMKTADNIITVDIGYSISKTIVTSRTRKLKAAYTIEMQQDLQAMHGIGIHEDFAEAFYGKAGYHKHKKQKWFDEYSRRVQKMKGIEKVNMQRTIKSLKNQIDNHENLYAEYYL